MYVYITLRKRNFDSCRLQRGMNFDGHFTANCRPLVIVVGPGTDAEIKRALAEAHEQDNGKGVLTYAFGILGYFMKMRDWPAAPLILGFILGPALEQHFRATLQMSGGSLDIFFSRPIAILFLGVTAFTVILSFRQPIMQHLKKIRPSSGRL